MYEIRSEIHLFDWIVASLPFSYYLNNLDGDKGVPCITRWLTLDNLLDKGYEGEKYKQCNKG